MIELLLLGGVMAVALLVAVGFLFMIRQRRQGTVRAVFLPRRDRGGGAEGS